MLIFVAGLSVDSRCERSSSTAEVVVLVGPDPFFLLCLVCAALVCFRRNANLAGGFAGRRVLFCRFLVGSAFRG